MKTLLNTEAVQSYEISVPVQCTRQIQPNTFPFGTKVVFLRSVHLLSLEGIAFVYNPPVENSFPRFQIKFYEMISLKLKLFRI